MINIIETKNAPQLI